MMHAGDRTLDDAKSVVPQISSAHENELAGASPVTDLHSQHALQLTRQALRIGAPRPYVVDAARTNPGCQIPTRPIFGDRRVNLNQKPVFGCQGDSALAPIDARCAADNAQTLR